MCEMSDSDRSSLINVREEWSFVIHLESEDTMLIGESKGGAKGRAVGGLGAWIQGKSMEGREHGKF